MSTSLQLAMFTDAECEIRHRVDVALRSEKLTGTASFVLWTLEQENAYGINNAVSINTLQNIWENTATPNAPSDRSIKDAVKGLLEDHDIPIGSCRIPGKSGYFFISSDSDAEDASRPLRAEIFSMFRRLKVINPKSAFVRKLQGQISLMEEESHGPDAELALPSR